jgi:hypothetical protein
MRKVIASALAASVVSFAAAHDARAQIAGINMGAPVWDGALAKDALAAAVGTGAPHVRVNFRLDEWSSPSDTTKHDGRTFFEAYDEIVDTITKSGLEVYGLLNDEIAPGFAPGSQAFEDAYAKNALAVVDRYKDRVRVWETINEPNDWAGGASARLTAAAFARAHARIYDEVKLRHAGDACWDVSIVTGPLFSFDDATAADYLDQTIAAGRAGGAWRAIRDALGRDPIDGVGYHVYVAQGPESPPSAVGATAGRNLDAVRAVLAKHGLGDRKVWISEIGYRASLLGEIGQADRLDAAFAALGGRSDVASIQWFTIGDFGGEGWGLYRDGGFAPSDRRPIYDRFVAKARAFAPDLAAKLEVDAPKKVAPGATVVARVKAKNLGKATWAAADGVRLGAASGCPSAWAVNETSWAPSPSDGYARSPTDARRYLAEGARVAPGAEAVIEVPFTAAKTPGKQRFAARMVKEGEAWFGATAIADVEVVAGAIPTAPGGGDREDRGPAARGEPAPAPAASDAGCGCREARNSDAGGAAKGVLFGLALTAIAIVARRLRARSSE